MADNSQRFLVICNLVNLIICLVIANRDFYGLSIMVDKFSDDVLQLFKTGHFNIFTNNGGQILR